MTALYKQWFVTYRCPLKAGLTVYDNLWVEVYGHKLILRTRWYFKENIPTVGCEANLVLYNMLYILFYLHGIQVQVVFIYCAHTVFITVKEITFSLLLLLNVCKISINIDG
jgi:hypothetical protein